jgi:hypothetical protein
MKGQVRIDAVASGTRVAFSHDAACPDIAPTVCADPDLDIPLHIHQQDIVLSRFSPTVSIGLGGQLQAQITVPFDAKFLGIEYVNVDGSPYDPPYGDTHHRNEILKGLGDAEVGIGFFTGLDNGLLMGASLGSSVPLGRTEENPFALADQDKKHQHMQMGTGTFVPSATAVLIWAQPRWGAYGFGNFRVPFYENNKGYTPPIRASGGLGPSFRPIKAVQVLALAEGIFEGAEHWAEWESQNKGRITAVAGLTAIWSVREDTVLQAQARTTAWQRDLGKEQIRQGLVVTLGGSQTF